VSQRCGSTGAAERAARAIFSAMGGVLENAQ